MALTVGSTRLKLIEALLTIEIGVNEKPEVFLPHSKLIPLHIVHNFTSQSSQKVTISIHFLISFDNGGVWQLTHQLFHR